MERITTHHGTVLYGDFATRTLRHGPSGEVPRNIFLASDDQGLCCLFCRENNIVLPISFDTTTSYIAQLSELSNIKKRTTFDRLRFIGGGFGLSSNGLFLCAEPNGIVVCNRQDCKDWEVFSESDEGEKDKVNRDEFTFAAKSMYASSRPIAFVLASTDHGTVIVNRFDHGPGGFGVGHQLFSYTHYDTFEIAVTKALLNSKRRHSGDGVVALDLGANIGIFSVEWAKHMTDWGRVISVEAQERIFYALAGNIAINNCFNVRAIFGAVSEQVGQMQIPELNHMTASSFGSLELRQRDLTENIGQTIDYRPEHMTTVRALSIDSLKLQRLDLMKIDVEGMEIDVLNGASTTIESFLPIMMIESFKTDSVNLIKFLDRLNYKTFVVGFNILAIHRGDPSLGIIEKRVAVGDKVKLEFDSFETLWRLLSSSAAFSG